jgi:asparagine synthase (glutamine-hydrolysing)
MCAIYGTVSVDPQRPVDTALMARACRAMAHRGPDGEGLLHRPGVGFGHRRLAIIDVADGAQPMATPDGRYWLTYNGEVYNFRELKRDLEARQVRFRTHSDTEVVLAAYATWGEACVERLEGMFAFGIWDQSERALFLARDHVGIKPLYFRQTPDRLMFASDIRGLLADPDVACAIDPQALTDYLSVGYTLGAKTIFQGIEKLEAGHTLTWTRGSVRRRCYWDLAGVLRAAAERPRPAAPGELRERLAGIVTAQMVSDVPVGAFLSGGVDSSAIVALMSATTPTPVQTFSIGFDEPRYSELAYASQVARHVKSDHRELVVHPDLEDLLPRVAWSTGEPFADTSMVPTYLVSQLASQSVKVVLSGDGGDEAFAGYDTYDANRLHGIYRHLPRLMRRYAVEPLVARLPVTSAKVGFDYKAKQFVKAGDSTFEEAHYSWRCLFSEQEQRSLLPPDLIRAAGGYRPFEVFAKHFRDVEGLDPLQRAQYVDVKTWLADDILVKSDRASMAHGLETRVPLLDRRLVEFALALPPGQKIRGRTKKYVFKAAVEPLLPREIVHRKKSGFNAPASPWSRGALRQYVSRIVVAGDGPVPLDRAALQRLVSEHASSRADHGFKIWALLMLRLWTQGLGEAGRSAA